MQSTDAGGVTGVVLAGGASSRMGRNKAALQIQGKPLLTRVVERLKRAITAVMVVGPPELRSLSSGVLVVPDAQPGLGPLGGIATALQTATTSHIFVVGCDMPFVEPALVRRMIDCSIESPDADAIVLRSARGTEQLHAVYKRTCLPHITLQLAQGDRSVRHLLQNVRVLEIGPEEAAKYDPAGLSTFNVNWPEDWLRALTLSHPEPGK